MESEQYDIMARAEDRHWWYLGLRDAMKTCLALPQVRLPQNPAILDAGCGTGGNLRFLSEILNPSYLEGFDVSELAIQHARRKCPNADIYKSDIRFPELRSSRFDLVVICDVLYASGVASSFSGLQTIVAAMSPGAVLAIHLPAYNWLESAHDDAVHTVERYRVGQVCQLLADLQLEASIVSYRLCSLLPFLVAKRLPSLLNRNTRFNRSDLAQPNMFLNQLLFQIVRFENRLIARKFKLPFGSSILAVATK